MQQESVQWMTTPKWYFFLWFLPILVYTAAELDEELNQLKAQMKETL